MVQYVEVMRRIFGLVAVIGLSVPVITACTTSADSSPEVASADSSSEVASADPSPEVPRDAEESATKKSEVASLDQDCATVDREITKQNEYTRANGIGMRTQEWFDEALQTWDRIWPQINDPDLKTIFRDLANATDADAIAMDNWIAYLTICDADGYNF